MWVGRIRKKEREKETGRGRMVGVSKEGQREMRCRREDYKDKTIDPDMTP